MDFFSKRTELTTGYQGYLRRYMEFDQLNSFDQHGHAFLRRLVSKRLTFVATEDYARVPTTDELDLNGIRFARTGAKRNSASAQLDARLTKFTDLTVKYDNTWVSFDRSDSLLIGGAVNGVSTHLSRRISERVSVGGEYALRYADLNQGTRQLTFQDVGGTAEIRLAPRTSASLGAGYSFLNDHSRDLFAYRTLLPRRRHPWHGARNDRGRVRAYVRPVVRVRRVEPEPAGAGIHPNAARSQPDVCAGFRFVATDEPVPRQ